MHQTMIIQIHIKRILHSSGAVRYSANQLGIIQTVKYRRIIAVLLKDGDQELDYAQKFLCTLYPMTNGLVEEQRDMLVIVSNYMSKNCSEFKELSLFSPVHSQKVTH